MGLSSIMKMQVNPDGLEGHKERERIRAELDLEAEKRDYWRREPGFEQEPVQVTRTFVIDDIKDCPSYVRGCQIRNCIVCKKRVWEISCQVRGRLK